MTRSSFLTVLVALSCLLGIAPAASAHYDTVLGRWLERDPKGYVNGMNAAQYATSSPVRFQDSHGLDIHGESIRRDVERRKRLRDVLGPNDPQCGPDCCEVRMYATNAFGLGGVYHMCLEIDTPSGDGGGCKLKRAELRSAHEKDSVPIGTGPLTEPFRGSGSSSNQKSKDSSAKESGGNVEEAWGIYVEDEKTCRRTDAKDASRIVPADGSGMTQCELAECLADAAVRIGKEAGESEIEYKPFKRNSNSYIGEVLRACNAKIVHPIVTDLAPAFDHPFFGGPLW